ncbi:hypothetical protein EJ05DRAFT_479530 [Pseudovirgaria hyperparasitica]|uniref:Uncharacterized protein n=1 Tax=Pseudovirgaria hyperparasitica TaxID=470096 RepID=A0A6A6VV46_9PEZI|nr:uncharacterized protein EJ05DRAFT_479530 [Pseudovirgaria hyperparasitica]KAF2754558.1 hypothetical protein EJ05DRAFT_479530 [Pseudovirgaria hyperparasitica]
MGFKSLIPPSSVRPLTQSETNERKKVFGVISTRMVVQLRDALSISSWLALGAILQSILFVTFGHRAFIPAVALIGFRMINAFLITVGVKANLEMQNTILSKFSAQIPQSDGTFSGRPADGDVVVLKIGARTDHPLGLFAPGFKVLGEYMTAMQASLEAHATHYSYLGGTSYSGMERATGNEFTYIMYFSTVEGVHAFAHDPLHRDGWAWWSKAAHDHIMIYHELFRSRRGDWEAVYSNTRPIGLAATRFEGKTGGGTVFYSPVVDANRGLLATSRGRMSGMVRDGDQKLHDDLNRGTKYEAERAEV